ncbi:MAG: reverse transcriptase domain-containing protein [Bacilli bacterium]|nr:reverse transcriptase domain-containing protein [Bacilli bacterium]
MLSNIYPNELDWELEKAGIKFVRFADDFLLFAKTETEIQKSGTIAKKFIESLGLEAAMHKTKFERL